MKKICFIVFILFYAPHLIAAERVINLIVAYKTVCFAGKPRQAIAVNNQIPAPTLHFKQGDHVYINVYNGLNQKTAIHWHGMLVPWQMDGVEGITQQGIPPGQWFHYDFSLHQAGTYWYHAHAGLQEQQGLYGAFIIDPIEAPLYHYNKDYAVVLSDWSNTYPDQILANLKKTGDFYDPRFPLQPSLVKFIHDYRGADWQERKKLLNNYKMMQTMRMSIYDLSDVAFDAFLLNGHSKNDPWRGLVKVGDVVRLRFIGAAGSSILHVKIPRTTMKMVHVQGNDVTPYDISDFSIAPGETYDVLIKIDQPLPYIIYAESMDTVGAAFGALVTSPHQFVNVNEIVPFPEPKPVTRGLMSHKDMNTSTMKHSMHNESMQHGSMQHSMATESSIIGDKIVAPLANNMMIRTSSGTKYEDVIAAYPTNNPQQPIRGIIKMELFGYMDRFIWFINGVPEYKAKPIVLEPGNRYRIIFTNTSMMHHPMHIHGHWFILRKGLGTHDPLLHTIDVAPGETIVADIDTDASGQWFFHCHLLYHMVAGMARVIQYSTLIEITKNEAEPEHIIKNTQYINRPIVRVDAIRPIDVTLVKHPMAHSTGFYFANFLEISADPFHNVQEVSFKGLYGPDYHKLELMIEDAEIDKGTVDDADIDIFYWHLISQFWAVKGGVNYFYRPSQSPYWQPGVGIEGMMPYFIDTNIRAYYYRGSAKLDAELGRDTQITNNFFVNLSIRGILATKTVEKAQIGNGLNQMRYIVRPFYRLRPGLNAFVEFEHEEDYGAFKRLQRLEGESTNENTLSLGLAAIF